MDLGDFVEEGKPAVFTFHILKSLHRPARPSALNHHDGPPPVMGEPSIQVGAARDSAYPRNLCRLCQVHAQPRALVDSTLPVPTSMVSSRAQGDGTPLPAPTPLPDLVHSITATKGSGQKWGAASLSPRSNRSQTIGSTSLASGVHICLCCQAGRSHLLESPWKSSQPGPHSPSFLSGAAICVASWQESDHGPLAENPSVAFPSTWHRAP